MMRKFACMCLILIATLSSAAAMELKPLLYSALIPGLGEWTMGYKTRAVTHWAVEAGCWAGNIYYREQGFDKRRAYEDYADAHWHEARWASAWSEEQPNWMDWVSPSVWSEMSSYWDVVDPASAIAFNETHEDYLESHFAPFHEDPQHYYENLGKYDWYRWGWDDYDDVSDDSRHRYVYGDLRYDSNTAFDNAHNLITLLVVARVISLADTFILLRRQESGELETADQDWRLKYAPMRRAAGGFRVSLTRSW